MISLAVLTWVCTALTWFVSASDALERVADQEWRQAFLSLSEKP